MRTDAAGVLADGILVDLAVDVDHAAHQRNVDKLADAGLFAVIERCHDRLIHVHAAEQVAQRDPVDDGHTVRVTGDMRGAGHGLRNDIIAGALGVGPCLAVGGQGSVNDVGLDLFYGLYVLLLEHALDDEELLIGEDIAEVGLIYIR